jgi:hypothetical protein
VALLILFRSRQVHTELLLPQDAAERRAGGAVWRSGANGNGRSVSAAASCRFYFLDVLLALSSLLFCFCLSILVALAAFIFCVN